MSFELLEQNILRDGIREPLAVWKGTILDGHNRYEIAKRHKLPFSTEEIEIKKPLRSSCLDDKKSVRKKKPVCVR
jgi:hypothetical protein